MNRDAHDELDQVKPVTKTVAVDEESRVRRAGRPAGIVVEVVGGPMDGIRGKAEICLTIGRADAGELCLPGDPSISSQHARIVIDGGQYWLEDLGSTNGTYLGGGRVEGRVPIAPGSVFAVGRTTLELLPT